jgi:replication-associated recombination protein RarA
MSTPALPFPQSLAEKYRPRTIGEFAGLEKAKRILCKFSANPYPSAWLFVGPPGVGKTTMALALGETLGAEVHHIPSQKCNAQAIDDTSRMCAYVPLTGRFHLVIVDEADKMTPAAQLALLSKLDATDAPPDTIWVFTCNATEGLEPRFLSRTRQIEFSSYGIANEVARLLESIWQREAKGASAPNFTRIVKDSANNVRDALIFLETELLGI